MRAQDELIALADRCFSYADGVAGFSLVNGFAFLMAVLEPDVRCALHDHRWVAVFAILALQVCYTLALLGLRRAERRLRREAGAEDEGPAEQFRRSVFAMRIVFTAVVTAGLVALSSFALGGAACHVAGDATQTHAALEGDPMSVYVVANIEIRDRERYGRYEAGFMEIFGRYEGELLGVSDDPERVEGDWPYTRAVLLRFPSREALHAWYDSAEYQELAQHRFAASSGCIISLPAFG